MKYFFIIITLLFSLQIQAKTTVITGKFSYQNNFTNLIELKYSDRLQIKSISIAKTTLSKDSTFKLTFDIEEPFVGSLFNKSVYITPGDSVNFNFYSEEGSFEVSGKNSGNYTFLSYIQSLDFPKSKNYTDYYEYKNVLKTYYSDLEKFLIEYSNKNSISNTFTEFYLTQNRYNYLTDLLNFPKTHQEEIRNDILNQIEKKDLNSGFFISESYTFFLNNYVSFFNKKNLISTENWKTQFDIINKVLDGEEKERVFIANFKALESLYIQPYKNLVDSLYQSYHFSYPQSKYRALIENLYNQSAQKKLNIPEDILNEPLLKTNGVYSILKDILTLNYSKLFVIDVWATWCEPCLEQMAASVNLKKQFKDYDVTFIYLSTDDEQEIWKDFIGENKYPNLQNSYLLENWKESEFYKYFQANAMPRYIVTNNQFEILAENIFNPSHPKSKEILEYLIKYKSKKTE